MLDPWIIEEIRRREEEQRQQEERRSRLEISIEMPADADRYPDRGPGRGSSDHGRPKQERGIAIIDFSV